jgi:small subunit ribosomal protein S27Ae
MAKPTAKKEKPKASKGVWKIYEIKDGSLTRKNKSCPKCGQGFFLAKHKGRETCGKCGYAEFGSKKE